MSQQLRQRLFDELDAIELMDSHSHINPHAPAATTLADLLGYHYYTELVHSAGMQRARIEDPNLGPKEKVARLLEGLPSLENTVQYSWLIEVAQKFFGFTDDRITSQNWESLYDTAAERMASPDWPRQVLRATKLRAVFLTNDFDDPLTGFDARVYVPCLRTDDLVFHLARPNVRERLEKAAGVEVRNAATLRAAIAKLFEHFTAHGARACAISLPPDFTPTRPELPASDDAVRCALRLSDEGRQRHEGCRLSANFVFWTIAELCADFHLPFDLMIGVNRQVYPAGVFQGQDLFDGRVSLIQYRELLNAFPQVTFPISVLASATNQELVAYSWIFPNVVMHGHWWYSNTPAYIEHDLAARLEAVPATKQIGYYSDMYKLEFGLPKFAMYKRILAKVLAERFVIDRGWSEQRGVDLGRKLLRDNVERIFAGQAAE